MALCRGHLTSISQWPLYHLFPFVLHLYPGGAVIIIYDTDRTARCGGSKEDDVLLRTSLSSALKTFVVVERKYIPPNCDIIFHLTCTYVFPSAKRSCQSSSVCSRSFVSLAVGGAAIVLVEQCFRLQFVLDIFYLVSVLQKLANITFLVNQ